MLPRGQWKKTHRFVWDSLIDYGRLERQSTLQDLEKALDIAYEGVLKEFDKVWCIKSLIVTHSNLVIARKVRIRMGIIS